MGCKCGFPLADDGDEDLEECCHHHQGHGHDHHNASNEDDTHDHEGGCCGGHGDHHSHDHSAHFHDENDHHHHGGGCCWHDHEGHHHHGHDDEYENDDYDDKAHNDTQDHNNGEHIGHNDNIAVRDGKNPNLVLPLIIGHRGACGYAPENTIESFLVAADMGVEMVEFDVKLTKDLVPVVFHDDMLERTTNGHGAVADMTLEELKLLDAGSWFSAGLTDSYTGIGIPTLEEALDAIIENDLGINLEIKPCPGREVETAEAALDVLSQYWDDHNRLLISSFSEVSLETAAHIAPGWARGYLIDDVPDNWRDIARHLGATTINLNGNSEKVTRRLIEEMIHEGYRICAYTINDPQRAEILISWGVDALFTDVPDVLQDVIHTSH